MPTPIALPAADPAQLTAPAGRWRQLAWLAAVELLAMALWFSATAVAPALRSEWQLSSASAAWLTISVQLGFVIGALVSAVLNLSERWAPPAMMAGCAAAGALFNGGLLLIEPDFGRTGAGFTVALLLRMATGAMLAGVYPTGMKLLATWFVRGRGLAIGVMVGSLTVGSALPHLLSALPLELWSRATTAWPAWKLVIASASACAVVAAIIALALVRNGPYLQRSARFDWRYFARVWTEPALLRANCGYLGHMFELYAMWTFAPQFLLSSYAAAQFNESSARMAGFATVAIGCIGCIVAGRIADRAGRSWTTIASLAASGSCALVAGSLHEQPILLTVVCLLWGLTVVADSAQFSAAISELCDPQFIGTALTIQTCAGFLLTTLTIRAVPALAGAVGWPVAFGVLALGPVFGIYHMVRLRGMPEAAKMAGGRR